MSDPGTMAGGVPDFGLTDAELRAAGSVKWTWAEADVLPAWVAEMDVRGCPAVVEALHRGVQQSAFGYPAKDERTGVPEATAAFLQRRFGWQVDPNSVVVCGDVMAGVRLVLDTLCDPAPVVVPVPSYPPFLDIVPLTGRRLVTVPCREAGSREAGSREAGSQEAGSRVDGRTEPVPTLDLDAIDAALAAGARTVLLSSPHNPLGRAFTAAELAALRDVALRHGARVISDEIHAPLTLPPAGHVPYASLDGTADHVTTLVAASKAWNLPGLKCAQIVAGNRADLKALRSVPHVANHGTSSLGVIATVAAYRHGEPWLDGVLRHLDGQRALFGRLLAERLPQVRWTPPEATYLAWLDARATGLADPAAVALQRGRVMVNPGAHFGPGYQGFVRVNLATSVERLTEVTARLATAWAADRAS